MTGRSPFYVALVLEGHHGHVQVSPYTRPYGGRQVQPPCVSHVCADLGWRATCVALYLRTSARVGWAVHFVAWYVRSSSCRPGSAKRVRAAAQQE